MQVNLHASTSVPTLYPTLQLAPLYLVARMRPLERGTVRWAALSTRPPRIETRED